MLTFAELFVSRVLNASQVQASIFRDTAECFLQRIRSYHGGWLCHRTALRLQRFSQPIC